ncbi:DUF3461 family protein [Endozoicomonas sp. SM1973]|uniref:DUF3461 family protein n=1 Tax=Spartinivicinus marinus TaxID=2994442 RepID=A0A853ICD3_9GAMM|nr:DUF3461 family protein [Spartinivicinus marinus]MCX4028510.1 DUF3461 family protein [Spartinivicinus marinus]NYZ67177.1 DUF3461 family protein [Spartinivicinus marinus]
MYDHLKSMGIIAIENIDRYSLRSEAEYDILKIYYKKEKGSLFARSEKFKYPRQKKTVLVDSGTHKYKDVTEISPILRHVVDELDRVTKHDKEIIDHKKKILQDLKHLEKVVSNKITEIEEQLKHL